MQIPVNIGEPEPPYTGPLLLAGGHRLFFALCAVAAVAGIGAWLVSYYGGLSLGIDWHGHEMVFGMAGADVGGFLTTAVPKWTNTAPLRGARLGMLVGLWLLGRAVMVADTLPWIDLLFPLALFAAILAPITRAANTRNYVVPVILLAFAGANALYHFGPDSRDGVLAGAFVVLILIALIGGRVTPAFTQNALRMDHGPTLSCDTPVWLNRGPVALLAIAGVAQILAPATIASGGLALLAGFGLLVRMHGWHSLKTLGAPLLWILHAGQLWLALGMVLIGLSDLDALWISPTQGFHALTTGAVGVMILAVGSRAALGHSGRPLNATRTTVAAYVLVNLGALLRVFAPGDIGIIGGGSLWVAGYLVFLIAYWDVLTKPRIDGQPG